MFDFIEDRLIIVGVHLFNKSESYFNINKKGGGEQLNKKYSSWSVFAVNACVHDVVHIKITGPELAGAPEPTTNKSLPLCIVPGLYYIPLPPILFVTKYGHSMVDMCYNFKNVFSTLF